MTFVQGRWGTSLTLQIARNAHSFHHLLTLEGHAPHYYWAERKRQTVPWSPPTWQRSDLIAAGDDGNPNCPPGLLRHHPLQEVVFIVRRAEPDSLTRCTNTAAAHDRLVWMNSELSSSPPRAPSLQRSKRRKCGSLLRVGIH